MSLTVYATAILIVSETLALKPKRNVGVEEDKHKIKNPILVRHFKIF